MPPLNHSCDDLKIIDFSHSYAGALATMVLADCGADVLKIEKPGGDPTRRHYAAPMWHRGKRSRELDLNTEAGQTEARDLAASADVLLHTFRPGLMERFGL